MLQKLVGVVLHTVKYSDKQNIVHIYTEQGGRMSFLVPAQRSKRSMVRQVLFQPLSLVEFDADIRPKSGLHPVKEAKAWYLFQSLPYDPYKSAIAMFLSEFLYRALKEETDNEALFSYLINSIQWLDACDSNFANFHLVFLMRLSRFLGLYPNMDDYADGCYFDMMNACFVQNQPLHGMFIRPEESARLRNLMRMNYDTMHLFGMNRMERNRCLDIINEYYRLHLPDFPELKSLRVLQELF
ncbi:DNA repair protein RecO [uncultured Bacteroides sp.]|uniref:DNA repair protein RecO n=1 Tax=uncultured Bacteroides sp. TaxID=162156 RepID=UPI00262F0D19|nr:DNA repair protein RecO [uncultured Bacteroides sp.]